MSTRTRPTDRNGLRSSISELTGTPRMTRCSARMTVYPNRLQCSYRITVSVVTMTGLERADYWSASLTAPETNVRRGPSSPTTHTHGPATSG